MEKRRQKRICKRLPVRFGNGHLDAMGFTDDLTSISLFIKTSKVFVPGTLLKIQVILPDDQIIDLTGTVVWAKKVPPNLIRHVRKAGIGIRLDKTPQSYIQFISTLQG